MALIESFGALIVPINEGLDVQAYIRQDGHTKCVALFMHSILQRSDNWTHRPSDVTGEWVVFQDTQELIEILDEAIIYYEEVFNAEA
jgi:hypothetical protein